MNFEAFKEWFTMENIMTLIQEYRSFGPLPGILLPMLEAFFPFLPLVILVMANANAFGLWIGFYCHGLEQVSVPSLSFCSLENLGNRDSCIFCINTLRFRN